MIDSNGQNASNAPYTNLNNYFRKKKEGSLPNVRSRSTLNDPMREKFNTVGRKRIDQFLNKTRDQSQKLQSLPVVKSKRALKEHNSKIKGNKGQRSGSRKKEKKKQLKSKSPRPRLPERYQISPQMSPVRSPKLKVAEKSDKKENRVQPTNFKQDLNDSIEI